MTFRPLHDRVLVKRVEEQQRTPGGIIIPDTAAEKPSEGKVIAVGPGRRQDDGSQRPLNVQKGDQILFGKWSGTEIKIDGETLLIMQESDILGIIDSEASKTSGRSKPAAKKAPAKKPAAKKPAAKSGRGKK